MNSSIRIRLRIIVYAVFIFLVALVLRLYFLQVISGELYAEMASESIARQQSIAAPRGNIYDRNGKLLVRSVPVAAVAVEPHILLSDDKAIELLAVYLDMDGDKISRILNEQDISWEDSGTITKITKKTYGSIFHIWYETPERIWSNDGELTGEWKTITYYKTDSTISDTTCYKKEECTE